MNPFVTRAIGGALLGTAGRAAYNATEGRPIEDGLMRYAAYGAMAGAGLRAIKPSVMKNGFENVRNFYQARRMGPFTKNQTAVMDTFKRAVPGVRKKFNDGMDRIVNKGIGAFGAASMRAGVAPNKVALRTMAGAMRGGIYGAMSGAAYGAYSDQESMISGAMKGALAGVAVGGATGRFKLNKKFNMNKIRSTWNKHIN